MNDPFEKAIDENHKKAKQAILECLLMIEADAKLLCPVDTGTLKRSLTHDIEVEEETIVGAVGSNMSYAYWAEKHQPYLEPAVDMNMEVVKRKIKEVMGD